MPRVSVVAKNYAKALFAAATKANVVDKITNELESFRQNFNLDFAKELKNPVISKTDSTKIIQTITTNLKLGKLISDFLIAVTRNKRLNLFPEIYEEFTRLAKLQKNILEVEIITTEKLENAEIERIKSMLNKQHAGKIIEVRQTVKKEILGGLQIKIGSNLIDASLKNQISTLGKQLIRAVK